MLGFRSKLACSSKPIEVINNSNNTSGMYYKHIEIVNDASRVIS